VVKPKTGRFKYYRKERIIFLNHLSLQRENQRVLSKQLGFWLEYITAHACREIGFPCHRLGVLFKTKDRQISEIDVFVDLGRVLFFIECKDTYIYSDQDLKKIDNLRKRINCQSYGIFVCTKAIHNLDFKKYGIGLIKYKYNYEAFREELKEMIAKKIISLSF
jgi:hypothetical protein